TGEVNSSINRAEGLGGTTSYWHNALIEMTAGDLAKGGVADGALKPYYRLAWDLFLSEAEGRVCDQLRDRNRAALESYACSVAHMVLPRTRANMWKLASKRHPGRDIRVEWGRAVSIVPAAGGRPMRLVLDAGSRRRELETDVVVACAGGLSTPALLA